ncbi:MAG TPA: uroporphyrinogen-III synthase [Roseiarcus sp.]
MGNRIALFRAREDADRSAAELRSRGFEVVLAPVLRMTATGAAPPRGRFDAVVATSVNAIALLAPAPRGAIAGLPIYVVGRRAADAAAEAGLALALQPAADVAALAAALGERLAARAQVLYLAGRDRKSALEEALRAIGADTTVLEIYVAEARQGWSEEETTDLRRCAAALHYSRRSAALAAALAARAGLAEHFAGMRHVCLSPDVAEPLREAGWARVASADAPDEAHLLAALERAFGS